MKLDRPSHPDPIAFVIRAKAFKDAADIVTERISPGQVEIREGDYTGFAVIPAVFLYFRSIELALKGVLGHHSVPERRIAREIGHDLALLLDECGRFESLDALGIDSRTETMLRENSDSYSKKWLEYSDDLWCTPDVQALKEACAAVYAAAPAYETE